MYPIDPGVALKLVYGFFLVMGFLMDKMIFYEGWELDESHTAIAHFQREAGKVQIGDSKDTVLSILSPTQSRIPDRWRKAPDKREQDGSFLEIYYFRTSPVDVESGTDDGFTPFVFRDGILVSIGWRTLDGPRTFIDPIFIDPVGEDAQSWDLPTSSGRIALSVLFSQDDAPNTPKSRGEEMVKCVTRGLTKAAPHVRLVPEEEFFHGVFGLKPDEVMLQVHTIGALLTRADIRQRARESGLTHLILVTGFSATIFELASGRMGKANATAEIRVSEPKSCEALGRNVARIFS